MDSTDEEAESAPTKQQDSQKRKIRQKDTFDEWFTENVEELITSGQRTAAQSEKDDELTLRQLMEKQESQRIIASPREYQLQLFERAKLENTIAVLDTGSGKTLIAVLLLRHIMDEELENRAAGARPRISFFLVIAPLFLLDGERG